MDGGLWTTASRNQYNLRDAVSRVTTQVRFNAVFALPNLKKAWKFINLMFHHALVSAGVSQVMDCYIFGT